MRTKNILFLLFVMLIGAYAYAQTPVCTITRLDSNPTKNSSVRFNVNFSVDVIDFVVGDITEHESGVTGTLSITGGNGTTDFEITASSISGTGTYGISVADGVCTRNGGSETNTAGAQVDYNIDQTAPTGYSVIIDQAYINNINKTALSFTFTGAETSTTCSYSINSSGGGTAVTGSGIAITSATQKISSIDVSGLNDGTLTLSVTLTDQVGNIGTPATYNSSTKDTNIPTVLSIVRNNPVSQIVTGNSVVFRVTFSESVTGVAASDFFLTTTGASRTINSVSSATGTTIDVTINTPNPDGDGTIRLDVLTTASIDDVAGNSIGSGGYTSGETYEIDKTDPSVISITRVNSTPTNLSAVQFLVTFNDIVTGDGTSNFSLFGTAATGSTFGISGTGATRTITANIGATDGTLRLDLSSKTGIQDDAGYNLTSTYNSGETYTIDRVAPSVSSINRVSSEYTNASSVNFTVDFSEDVKNVSSSNFTLTGSASNASFGTVGSSGDPITVTVNTGSVDGTLGLDLSSIGSITDDAGNSLSGTRIGDQTYTVDKTQPAVELDDDQADNVVRNTNVVVIDATFTETNTISTPTIKISKGATILVNNLAMTINGDNKHWRYTWTVSAAAGNDGTYDVAITTSDDAGNACSAPTAAPTGTTSYIVDNISPAISSVTSDLANGSYKIGDIVPIKILFSENVDVTGTPQLLLETGTTDQYAYYNSGSGASTLVFNYTIQAGDLSSDLNYVNTSSLTGTIKDIAGNTATLTLPGTATANSLGGSKDIVADGVLPTITNVTSNDANATLKIGSSIDIRVVFSELVYVTGTPQLTLETGTPDQTIDYTGGDGTNTLIFHYVVQNGDLSSDLTYVATSSLTGTIKDFAGNGATLTLANPTAQYSLGYNKDFVVDGVAPSQPTIVGLISGTYNTNQSFTVTYGEAGGTRQYSLNNGSTWNAYPGSAVPLSTDGTTYNVIARQTDVAGNISPNSSLYTVTIDKTTQTPTLTNPTDDASSTSTGGVLITYTLPENATNGTVVLTFDCTEPPEPYSSISDRYVEITPAYSTAGTHSFTLDARNFLDPANSAFVADAHTSGSEGNRLINGGYYTVYIEYQDALGNPVKNDYNTGLFFSSGPPIPSFVEVTPDPRNYNVPSTEGVTLHFSWRVNIADVQIDHFTLTQNGSNVPLTGVTITPNENFSGTATNFKLNVSGLTSLAGTYVLTFDPTGTLATTIKDKTGNAVTAGVNETWITDLTPPTVNITSSSSNPTNSSTISFTAVFSEHVNGLLSSEISVVNGSVTSFTTSDDITYDIAVTPITSDQNVSVSIPAAVCQDDANNNNTVSNTCTILWDTTQPSVAISTATDPTNASEITVNILFSENVTGFTLSDVVVTGLGSNSDFTSSGTNYSFKFTPTADGTITVNIAANVCTDAATNANTAASQLTIRSDRTLPQLITRTIVSDNTPHPDYVGSTGIITINVTSSEEITTPIAKVSKVLGIWQDATSVTNPNGDKMNWIISYNMIGNEETGIVPFSISYNDLANNSGAVVTTTTNSSTVTYDNTKPTLATTPPIHISSNNPTSSTYAKVGDVVTLTFTSNENIENVVVKIGGKNASVSKVGMDYTCTYTMSTLDVAEGDLPITIDFKDFAGNDGLQIVNTSDGSKVTYDITSPSTPSIPDLDPGSDSNVSTDNITNINTSITFNGTAEANSLVKLYSNSVQVASATATAGGAWTVIVPNFTEGTKFITATATDGAGNVSAASTSLEVVIDITQPNAPSAPDLDSSSDTGTLNTDNYTSDSSPTFNGTAEPNSTVTIYIDGNPGVSVITNSFGLWTATENPLLTGTYVITAKAKDAAGNVSSASSGLTINVDLSSPAAPSTPDLTTSSDSGTSNADDYTNDNTPTFAGTAESSAIVKLYVDAVEVASTTATGGNWTITSSVLTDGTKSITAKTIDAAGNESILSSNLSITIDTNSPSKPGAPDLDPTSDSGTLNTDNITNDNTPIFNGTAEANTIVKLYANGLEVGNATATGGNWTITSSLLSDGVKSITITATDAAGNVSTSSDALSVTIDATNPSKPSTPDLDAGSDSGLSNTDNLTNIDTPTLLGTAEPYSTVTVYSGATVIGTTTASSFGLWTTSTSVLSEVANSITIKATDASGNTSISSDALVITVDKTAPAVPNTPDLDATSDTGLSNGDNITSDNTPAFNGTAEVNAVVKLYDGATVLGTATATGGNWTITSSSLSNGTKNIQVTATDAAGNESAKSTTLFITIDTNNPSKPGTPNLDDGSDLGVSNSDDITNDNTPTFTGTAESGSTVRLYCNGSEVGNGVAIAGNWTITASVLSDGVRSIAITSTDASGNTSITSDFLSITIDTQIPNIISATVPFGVYKVGSVISISLVCDDKTYSGQTVSVNSKNQTLVNNNNNSYTISYTVQENDNPQNSVGALPSNIVLVDVAGNIATINSLTVQGGTLTIDAVTPQITSVTSNAETAGNLKIGDQIVFTATPTIAETGLIITPSTYNSKSITWVTTNGGITYTATYTIQDGDANQETPLQLGNVTIADAAGNVSNPYSYTGVQKLIYGIKPTVTITGNTTRCDYPAPTVPITFTFTGKKPYTFTYNDGTSNQTVTALNADNYIIQVLKGTYSLVSLVDATGNTNNIALANATITVNALPTIQFTSPSITVNENDAAVNLMSYVQIGTGGNFTGEGVTTTNYFYPSLVEAKPTIPYQLTYTLTNINGCTSTKTFHVTVTSDLGYISGLDVNYCKNSWSPTSVIATVNNVTNYAGLSPAFTLEPASNQTSTVDWNHFSINPRDMKVGSYVLKYSYVEQSTGSNREIQYSFDIDSVGKDIDFKLVDNSGSYAELGSEYCKNSTDILLEVINNYPKGGSGYFTGPTTGFTTDDKSFKATFRPSSAPLDQQFEIAFYFVTDASSPKVGCSSDTVRKIVTVHSLTPISFELKDNYNYEEKTVVLNGTPTGGVFSSPDNVIINSTTISPSLTTNFNTNNPVSITYTYTDGNQCTSLLTKTTKIYKADALIDNLNSLYCYEDKTVDISCSPVVNGVTYSGVFSSSKGAITQSVSPGAAAKYSVFDAGDGQDTVRFTYYVGPIAKPTEYKVTKLVFVDSIGDVSMVVDTKYCNNIEKVDINVNHRQMNGENSFTYDGTTNAFSSNPLFATLFPSKETTFGDHVISCTFTSDKGCIGSDTKIVAINPVATFPASPFVLGEACPGTTKPVQFVNKTTIPVGATMSWSWNIEGRANASTEKNPEWQFTSTGSKAVYLEAITEKGCVSRTPTDYINVGISAKADFTWNNECLDGTSIQFTDNSSGGTVDRSRWIFNNDTIGYDKNLTYSFAELGRYDLKLAIQTKDRCVDTIVKQIVIQPYIKFQELPNMVYNQNFDSNNEFYNWASRGISDAYKTTKWELGTPDETKIKLAASGSNAWFTKLTSKTDIENSQVVSPCFDFTGLSKPLIKMNVWSYSESKRDGAVLQYSIDKGQTWKKLGTKGEGINWFNSDNILTNPGQQPTTEEPEGWSQVPMNEWTNVRHNLDSLIGETNVRFRIAYSKDATNSEKIDGFAFDDVWIGDRQQIVLGEYFTNVNNTIFNDFMRKYEIKESVDFIPIHYHTGDAIFDDYSAGPSSRLFYYGSLQNPYILSNGTEASSLADTVSFKNTNDVQSLHDPKVEINLSISSSNIGISLKALKDLSGEELVLFTAIVKKTVDKDGSTYYNVIRRFLPNPGGILLSTSGWIKDMEQLQWISVSSSDFAEYLNSRLVVFVQNAKTKEVYQVVSSDLSNVTDIKPIDVGKLVDIYPNPAISNLIVECEYQIERLVVLDITGRIVGVFNPKQQQFSLPVNSLKDGLYILRGTTTNRGEFIKKFVKQ